MKFLNLFYFVLIITFSTPSFTQDANDENVDQEPTTVEALLALVKEGKVKEQAENVKREATFLASKNKISLKKSDGFLLSILVLSGPYGDSSPLRPMPAIQFIFDNLF